MTRAGKDLNDKICRVMLCLRENDVATTINNHGGVCADELQHHGSRFGSRFDGGNVTKVQDIATQNMDVGKLLGELNGQLLTVVTRTQLLLPDEVWQTLGVSKGVADGYGGDMVFYRHRDHVALIPPTNLKILTTNLDTSPFRTTNGGYNRQAFCAVLGITPGELLEILETPRADGHEPPHDLEHLEQVLLSVAATVREISSTTWHTVRMVIDAHPHGTGHPSCLALLRSGRWREATRVPAW
jgi:hypothetical protein